MRKLFSLISALLVVGSISVSLAAAQTLLVANKSDDTVDLIALASGRSMATLHTGGAPHEIAVAPDGATAVIANYGGRGGAGNSLTVVDVAAATVRKTIDLESHRRPHGVEWLDDKRVAVTTEGSGHLTLVDIDSGTVSSAVPTGQSVSHMVALAGSRAFVANIGSGSVTVIDTESGKKLTDIATGAGAEGIAATSDGVEIWVTNREADTLTVIDAASLEILATLPCPGFPIRIALAPDGKNALVSAARSGEVVLFDVAERRELRRAQLDLSNAPDAARRLFGDRFGNSPVPVGLVIAPDGETAWVAATQADAVVVLDPKTLTVRDVLAAGREPDGMAFSPLNVAAAGGGSG